MVTREFEVWANGFSGCDGGNIGDKSNRGIWFCGIEWGGGFNDKSVIELKKIFAEKINIPPAGYENWKDNLAYIYNWQAMKLLSVINGENLKNYKTFAEKVKPFTIESEGSYFKMNLYPLPFKKTSHLLWDDRFSQSTGFSNKQEYIDWIKLKRFPVMREWTKKYSPKLVICTGITYQNDFFRAFGDTEMELRTESIDNRQLIYGFNKEKTLVVVIPFMVNRNGLTKNVSIQKFGESIEEILSSIN